MEFNLLERFSVVLQTSSYHALPRQTRFVLYSTKELRETNLIRTVCHDTNRDTNHSTLYYELQLRTAALASRRTMAPFVARVMSKSYQVRILFSSEYI